MADTNVLMLYFKDIESFPLLSHKEEMELARRIKKGDSRARKKMVQANLRLVVNIAKRYSYTGVPMLDLIEEGNIGLMKAVKKYDPKRGFRFSTYAGWWIKQYIMRAIANQGKTIRVPVYMVEAILKYKKTIEMLTHRLKRIPTTKEVAKSMGMSLKKVSDVAQTAQTHPTSLETPIGEEDAGLFLELIEDESASAPDERMSEALRDQQIRKLIKDLPTRDRQILMLRFGIDKKKSLTLQEIAKHFKITKERVRQIEERAIKRLKDLIVEAGVKEGIEDEEVLR
ncbi:MAG: RNA polymerase sigma factor RpoD/SigA [Candidatus Omnitrophica bacterium]|nr:RNA polymerase sigma factor RpoD/SigA [Candidatus Omnitrophota bacterium]